MELLIYYSLQKLIRLLLQKKLNILQQNLTIFTNNLSTNTYNLLVIHMNKLIIINYIKKLTKNDIYNYCKANKIQINDDEVDVIYYYIKNKYNMFFDGYHEEILNEIKYKVRSYIYNIILELYNKYRYIL